MKNLIYIILGLLVLGLVAFFAFRSDETTVENILSFEDCLKAGYPVMEIFPRQCRTPDGRTFAEEIPEQITYDRASADMIVLDNPFPGAVTGKGFMVFGKARGNWYFEATFPITVLDKDGKTLAETFATAQGDPATGEVNWMTEEFVNFKGEVKVPESYIGPATLILKKDNPSGLSENDASISLPITIEY